MLHDHKTCEEIREEINVQVSAKHLGTVDISGHGAY
jgi:hypothetical protein